MKSHKDIQLMESCRKLLQRTDELRSLEKDYDFILSLREDLINAAKRLMGGERELAEQLLRAESRLYAMGDRIYVLICQLEEEIEQAYADLLVQEADANESIPPAMQVMLPPYLKRIS